MHRNSNIKKQYLHVSATRGHLQVTQNRAGREEYNTYSARNVTRTVYIISLFSREGNKLQRQKILIFIYPICKHNWRNISTVYIYKKTSIKRNILTIKQIHWEAGRSKDLSAPLQLPMNSCESEEMLPTSPLRMVMIVLVFKVTVHLKPILTQPQLVFKPLPH